MAGSYLSSESATRPSLWEDRRRTPTVRASAAARVWPVAARSHADARARRASSLQRFRCFFGGIARTSVPTCDGHQPRRRGLVLRRTRSLITLEEPHQRCPLSKAHRHANFVSYATFLDEMQISAPPASRRFPIAFPLHPSNVVVFQRRFEQHAATIAGPPNHSRQHVRGAHNDKNVVSCRRKVAAAQSCSSARQVRDHD